MQVDEILGHGGFFKTREVGQKIMAAAVNVPVSVMENAGEGGAWACAARRVHGESRRQTNRSTTSCTTKVFAGQKTNRIAPNPRRMSKASTPSWSATRTAGEIERAAVKHCSSRHANAVPRRLADSVPIRLLRIKLAANRKAEISDSS